MLAYSDLNHHDQIHLGSSPEERAVQRATECTLEYTPGRNIAGEKSALEIQAFIFISFLSRSACI